MDTLRVKNDDVSVTTGRRLSEDLFRAVVTSTTVGIVVVDPDGRIVLANPSALEMLGYASESELLGRRLETLVPSRLRDPHEDQRAEFASNVHTRRMGIGLDLQALRKDGAELPVEIGLAPMAFSDGAYVVATLIDITPRKRGAEAMRTSGKRATAP